MAKLIKQNIPFTQIANEILADKNLSWKAKGLFSYLFSKPDGWDFSGDRIVNEGADGRKVVYSGLKELEQIGYLIRQKLSNGKVVYTLKYSDQPVDPNGQKPVDQNGKLPKRQIAKTGSISNKEEESNTDKESNKDIAELIFQFQSVNPAIKRMYNNPTQRGAAERLVQAFGLEIAIRGAKAAVGILGTPYAPKITTPYELELSWAKLVAFIQENRNKVIKNKIHVL